MLQITMTETRQEKNPNTKTTYITESVEIKIIDKKQYNNIISDDTCRWFRRLGGSETVSRSYTCDGYKVTKLTSISPDRQSKVVKEFNFKWTEQKTTFKK